MTISLPLILPCLGWIHFALLYFNCAPLIVGHVHYSLFNKINSPFLCWFNGLYYCKLDVEQKNKTQIKTKTRQFFSASSSPAEMPPNPWRPRSPPRQKRENVLIGDFIQFLKPCDGLWKMIISIFLSSSYAILPPPPRLPPTLSIHSPPGPRFTVRAVRGCVVIRSLGALLPFGSNDPRPCCYH